MDRLKEYEEGYCSSPHTWDHVGHQIKPLIEEVAEYMGKWEVLEAELKTMCVNLSPPTASNANQRLTVFSLDTLRRELRVEFL